MQHTLVMLVVNRPTVLNHIASLVSRRGYNITSIAAGSCEDPRMTRLTLVVDSDPEGIVQVQKQLEKLVDTVSVVNVTGIEPVVRELALIKVRADAVHRSAIVDIANIFRAKIEDVHRESMVLELSGTPEKINALILLLEDQGIIEITRTGLVAMARGEENSLD